MRKPKKIKISQFSTVVNPIIGITDDHFNEYV
jgi:hypothetical protein